MPTLPEERLGLQVGDVRQEGLGVHTVQAIVPSAVETICGWCPDASVRTAAAQVEGRQVSHGCCASCAARVAIEEGF